MDRTTITRWTSLIGGVDVPIVGRTRSGLGVVLPSLRMQMSSMVIINFYNRLCTRECAYGVEQPEIVCVCVYSLAHNRSLDSIWRSFET